MGAAGLGFHMTQFCLRGAGRCRRGGGSLETSWTCDTEGCERREGIKQRKEASPEFTLLCISQGPASIRASDGLEGLHHVKGFCVMLIGSWTKLQK